MTTIDVQGFSGYSPEPKSSGMTNPHMSEEATAINETSKRGASETESIDLRRYWAAFRKYLWTFVVLSVGVFALVLAAAFVLPKSYTATSELVIDPQLSDTLDIKSTPQSSQQKP